MDYKKLIPKSSFIYDYMQYMDSIESPYAYDFWCALWLISAAVGRDVVVSRPHAPVFLNMYLVLVAESGVTRKSTCVRRAQVIAEALELDLITDQSTPEALLYKLGKLTENTGSSRASIVVPEMVRFFGREKYNLSLPGMLTDLYDCPDYHKGGGTIRRGEVDIRNVYLNVLTASTSTWLHRAMNPDIIEGGFTSRTIFICDETRKRKIAWPERANGDYRFPSRLTQFREDVRQCDGIEIQDGARRWYTTWYNKRIGSDDAYLASFEAREDDHVLRVAGLLAINDLSLCISTRHVKAAVSLVAQAKHNGASLFEGNAIVDSAVIGTDRIREVLIDAGLDGVQSNELRRMVRSYMDTDTFHRTMHAMHELGLVKKTQRLTNQRGKPATVWTMQPALTQKGAMASVFKFKA